jgi:hypothetical protein
VFFIYKIIYSWIRPSTYTKLPSTSNSAVVAATFQEASPGLEGSYTFSINGVPLKVTDSKTFIQSTSISVSNWVPYIGSAI